MFERLKGKLYDLMLWYADKWDSVNILLEDAMLMTLVLAD